jgi:deoxyribodipyrimidine photo-lyase
VTVSVLVFTRDLCLTDNPALAAATAATAMVPLFVLDEAIMRRSGEHANRLGFLLGSLRDLDASLRAAGGALAVRAGPWVATVIETARAAGAGRIHLAHDVSGYAAGRLAELERAAAGARMTVERHPGITVVGPEALRAPGGGPYQVFTPYYRRWLTAARRPVLAAPTAIALPGGIGTGQLARLAGRGPLPRAALADRGGESRGLAAVRRWAAGGLARIRPAPGRSGCRCHLAPQRLPPLRLRLPARRGHRGEHAPRRGGLRAPAGLAGLLPPAARGQAGGSVAGLPGSR